MAKRKPRVPPDAAVPAHLQGPSRRSPWLATTQRELDAQTETTFVYILVDLAGAQLLADGHVPAYVKDQAASALDWTLADCGKKAANA